MRLDDVWGGWEMHPTRFKLSGLNYPVHLVLMVVLV